MSAWDEEIKLMRAEMQRDFDERLARVTAQIQAEARHPAPPSPLQDSTSWEEQRPAARIMSMAERAQQAADASRDYGYGGRNVNYMEPPQHQWGSAYQPYSRNQPEQSWSYPSTGIYAHGQKTQPPYQPLREESPPQPTPQLKSMAELFREEYGYDCVHPGLRGDPVPICSYPDVGAYVPPTPPYQQYQAEEVKPPQQHSSLEALLNKLNELLGDKEEAIHYMGPPHQQWEAYTPSYQPQPQYQAQRPAPPLQVHQDPAIMPFLAKINEKLDMIVTDMTEVEAKVAEHAERIEANARQVPILPADTLPLLEEEKGFAVDPSSPSHERDEAIEATEEEPSEEIPVPTVYPPSRETSGRSEEEQCHEHKPFPSCTEIEQDSHVDTCSTHHEEVLVDQVLYELVRLDGDEKAKESGVLQDMKAAPCKKPPRTEGEFKKNQDKVRRARGKRPRAASRMRKSSAPHHTTKVKMKSKCGVDDDKALMLEGEEISSGRCIPKMAYLKHIAREDLFPPPFIP